VGNALYINPGDTLMNDFFKLHQVAIGVVRAYQWTIRPVLGPRCRYIPHCSDYAIEALERHGFLSGSWLTLKRLGRCHPGCAGGLDLVPEPVQAVTKKIVQKSNHF
jgi:uncharacterized protein